jgi:hypothetical protein
MPHSPRRSWRRGTKYEQLTAIVFKILEGSACVIHDVRLRSDHKKAQRQIDVQISSTQNEAPRRILVECKNHEDKTKVGLSEIREFNGALIQLQPALGIFVTTSEYTAAARNYAEDEKITLAVLRPLTFQDWSGRVRAIMITANMVALGTPIIDWMPTGQIADAAAELPQAQGEVRLDTTPYYDRRGQPQGNLAELLDAWRRSLTETALASSGIAEVSGTYDLPEPAWLPVDGGLAEFSGFNWRAPISIISQHIEIGEGQQIADWYC